jgi:hypothetical protein
MRTQTETREGKRGWEIVRERGGKREGQDFYLEPILPLHILEHVPANGIFHDDGQVLISKENLLELDDVRVQQIAVVADLPLHIFGYLRIGQKNNVRPSDTS